MGTIWGKIAPQSALSQQFPPPSTFDTARDIPDLSGKVMIVTGGNSGIGYHTVKQLLLKDAKVYLAARSPTRCADAMSRLKKETNGKEPILLQLDLADLCSVRKAAEDFLSKEERLDILFNNAGVMVPPINSLTTQGYDLRTNVLGHYFFTMLLMPALKRSTTHYNIKARVITTSSFMHEMAPGPTGINWEILKGGAARDKAIKKLGMSSHWKVYALSKIGAVFLSNILVEDYGDTVVSCALHPGGLSTDLQQHTPGWQQWLLRQLLYAAPYGALTQLWAGTTLEAEAVNGKYFIPWARKGQADPRAADKKTRNQLKVWLEEQVKVF
ncbi:NAD-P-binding protein [Ramaria rubella]|nr:NAD-P-binding protein [Ramaria rubella]